MKMGSKKLKYTYKLSRNIYLPIVYANICFCPQSNYDCNLVLYDVRQITHNKNISLSPPPLPSAILRQPTA